MLKGVNPATFFILPMLGKHPDEYPRFRDCFVKDNKILIYTRTGGNNRNTYAEENKTICNMNGFVSTYDDEYDSTYAMWVFNVPEKWLKDFNKIINGNMESISNEYLSELKKVYPKLADKFDNIFRDREKTHGS